MFHHIKGIVTHLGIDYIVVDTGGVGYKLFTSLASKNKIQTDSEITMFTYLHVREGIMDLYGFLSEEELNTFMMLISVSGVGPKAGLSVLSCITATDFALAVITNNVKEITKAQGVGPKVAQRIILELKDKLKKNTMATENATMIEEAGGSTDNEAANALVVLGYSYREAQKAVNLVEEGLSLEDTIREALKKLMR